MHDQPVKKDLETSRVYKCPKCAVVSSTHSGSDDKPRCISCGAIVEIVSAKHLVERRTRGLGQPLK